MLHRPRTYYVRPLSVAYVSAWTVFFQVVHAFRIGMRMANNRIFTVSRSEKLWNVEGIRAGTVLLWHMRLATLCRARTHVCSSRHSVTSRADTARRWRALLTTAFHTRRASERLASGVDTIYDSSAPFPSHSSGLICLITSSWSSTLESSYLTEWLTSITCRSREHALPHHCQRLARMLFLLAQLSSSLQHGINHVWNWTEETL